MPTKTAIATFLTKFDRDQSRAMHLRVVYKTGFCSTAPRSRWQAQEEIERAAVKNPLAAAALAKEIVTWANGELTLKDPVTWGEYCATPWWGDRHSKLTEAEMAEEREYARQAGHRDAARHNEWVASHEKGIRKIAQAALAELGCPRIYEEVHLSTKTYEGQIAKQIADNEARVAKALAAK